MNMRRLAILLALCILLSACSAAQPAGKAAAQPLTMAATGLPLLRGVNLGDMLEAPNEGDWGFKVHQDWFKAIKDAGFDHVRIPVCFSAHASKDAPYAIDPAFLGRVDEVVGWAVDAGLGVVLDLHNYTEYCSDPSGQRLRLLGIWANLAEHYKSLPGTVAFELLNEPNGKADSAWNQDAAELISIVRKTNPDRWLIVDGLHWANLEYISALRLPKGDHNLIVAVHMYEPMKFTHQGAEWVQGSGAWRGTMWEGTASDRKAVDSLLRSVANAGKRLGAPVYMGEFGTYSKADYDSRVRWTTYVARQAESDGFGWAYWEFCAGFGVYNASTNKYDSKLLPALIPPQ